MIEISRHAIIRGNYILVIIDETQSWMLSARVYYISVDNPSALHNTITPLTTVVIS